ncbi:hypothetical protein FZEAL_5344 [Fusarium zealandicum]|uniref:Uncharacterized protein n=1 Tax=Fusarium zealandicum TaxID=1053134 RepID=A0A8H4UKL6_9HYPO|nr:hypothetical protein FZEAL_5344 [Fusarium zealandicum]
MAIKVSGRNTTHSDAQAASDTLARIAGERQVPSLLDDGSRRATAAMDTLVEPDMANPRSHSSAACHDLQYQGPREISGSLMPKAVVGYLSFFDDSGPEVPDELWDTESLFDLERAIRGLVMACDEALFEVLWRWRYPRATRASR